MAEIKDNKLTRELTTRAVQERPKQWMQPEMLPEPDKEPGYNYRWIRVSTLNNSDPRNVSAKFREGWEPVAVEEQPQFRLLADPQSRFKDSIEIGGLLLCKTPTDFVAQRNAFYAKQAQAQSDAVDNSFMRQSDARMPLFQERKSSSSFGRGV
jgi:hypothetical protein